jgi:thiopurine S-methyltransferase
MEPDFWHQRWNDNAIPFHEGEANVLLVKHAEVLAPGPGRRILVPLCGKAYDMQWLIERGCHITGAEFSPIASQAFFEENGHAFEVREEGAFKVFESESIRIYCGDMFELGGSHLKDIDAIYDRAALVALPPDVRPRYTAHLLANVAADTPMLIITFDYNQADMNGPPFSVPRDEVRKHYGAAREIIELSSIHYRDDESPLARRGLTNLTEHATAALPLAAD